MPTPNWDPIPVRAHYVNSDGSPTQGRVVFTPRVSRLVDAEALRIIIGSSTSVALDAEGKFEITLPASDDPDITPTGFTWQVRENFTGGANYSIETPLSMASVGVDLALVAPVAPSPGEGVISVSRVEFDAMRAQVDEFETQVAAVSVSTSSAALTPSSSTVAELGNVNEWTVSAPLQVSLPVVPAGAQYTVHVTSGYQDLTWPALTEVFGATSQDEAWVTLIRGEAGWIVLVPSGGGGAGLIDTNWSVEFSVLSIGGNLTYQTGDSSMLGAGWTVVTASSGFGGATARIRRSGNQLLVSLLGFKATATAEEVFLRLPMPTGLVVSNAYHSVAAVGAVEGVHRTFGVSVRPLAGNLEFSSLDLTEGLTFGRTAVGELSSDAIISIPIEPSSTWGA